MQGNQPNQLLSSPFL